MPAPRQLTDEQRKAMFARLRGAGVSVYDATGREGRETPSAWDKAAAAYSGWKQGAAEGNENVLNALTFGLTDNLGWTSTWEQTGKAADLSKMFAGIGAAALYAAAGEWVGGYSTLSLSHPFTGEAGVLKALGGFMADRAIDEYRDKNYDSAFWDKTLGLLGEAAGYYGAYGEVAAARAAAAPVVGLLETPLGWLGSGLEKAGSGIWSGIEKNAPPVAKGLEKAFEAYSKFSDVTGASWKDFGGDEKLKSAFLTALAVGRTAADEWYAHKGYNEAMEAWNAGNNYTIDYPDARGLLPGNGSYLGTLGAFAIGTTGNPIEKQTRYGINESQKEVGAWRAAHDIIDGQYARGEITAEQYNAAKDQLLDNRPFRDTGNTIWSGVSAASTYMKYLTENKLDSMDRQSFATVLSVLDGDTVKVQPRLGGDVQTIRVLGIDTPEIAHHAGETADHMGNEAWKNAQDLLPVGSTVLVTKDSHSKASGQDIHGRELASVAALTSGGTLESYIPGLGKLSAGSTATDLGKNQLEQGLAGIRYTKLSGRTDNGKEYEQLQKAAQTAGVGIWAPEAQGQNKSWVGNEPTYSDLYTDPQKTLMQTVQTKAGAGLMYSGNSGVLGLLGDKAGQGVATAWNALLAGFGASDYNQQAQRASDRVVRPPATFQSDYDKRAYEIIHGTSLPTPAEYDRRAAEILAGK